MVLLFDQCGKGVGGVRGEVGWGGVLGFRVWRKEEKMFGIWGRKFGKLQRNGVFVFFFFRHFEYE
jgi:hypothetical protein